uniref:EF-hand domain-containing protein n=1 Tax=Parascaris univalens TaxID=6257 RepID=A0A915B5Q9_PARUN
MASTAMMDHRNLLFSGISTAQKPKRRHSQWERALRRTYAPPPLITSNKLIGAAFSTLYWTVRSLQFSFFYRNVDKDEDETVDLLKWESSVQPPSIAELRRRTQEAFSCKYIKYMYARFKNECPTGRMRLDEFKKMFGPYLPERLNEEYILRLFNAFGKGKGEITFQDLMETLAMLNYPSPQSNAVWTIRMIKGKDANKVNHTEFTDFVRSVFQLSRLVQKRRSLSSNTEGRRMSIQDAIVRRADESFSALDKNNDGYVDISDLAEFFQEEGRMDPLHLRVSTVSPLLGKGYL